MFLLSHSEIYMTPDAEDGGGGRGEGGRGRGMKGGRKENGKRRGGGNRRVSREKGSCMVHLPLHT